MVKKEINAVLDHMTEY